MKIGLTSVTFRKKSIDEIINIAKNARLNSIEWGTDIHLTDVNKGIEIANKLEASSLNTVTIGSYYKVGEKNWDKFKDLCELAKITGAKNIRIWLGDKSSKYVNAIQRIAYLDEVTALSRLAAEYGIDILFEFHKNTLNDNAKESIKFLKELNLKNVKTIWQPFGNRIKDIKNLKTLLPYLSEIHIFQWNKIGKRYPLNKGKKFWQIVFDILKDNNYKGNYIMEFVKNDDEEEFYKDAEFLISLLNQK